jgi:hypothetical protein
MFKWELMARYSERPDCDFFFLFLGAFAKLRKATISFVKSVRPDGTTRLPLDGFS